MCKVEVGKRVTTDRDLQNLVTSVILRQKSSFDEKEIVKQTRRKLKDSMYVEEDKKVQAVIHHTMRVLDCNGVFGMKDGVYCIK